MPQTSDTYLDAMPHGEIVPSAPPRRGILGRVLIWIVAIVVLAWIAGQGISVAIQHTKLNRVLTARIQTSFGRPVDVGSYDFSFWGGPALEAQSITVAEDPRFGPEYFLRAESMTVGLRWRSLLRGRIDLGTLSLIRPSLNVVRNADGQWNLAEWLPRPAGASPATAPLGPTGSSALRFSRIEVQEGRINFKRGAEKLPFALTGVTGTVETNTSGRWRLDLDAAPWRAAIVLQQMGVIHVSGDVGGTSSRLRPAALSISWTDASIPDVLRLAFGGDSGIRGGLALALNARTRDADDRWDIEESAQLSQIHRWDLALRPDNPSVNVNGRMEWSPASSSLELENVALEAPHSSARGVGRILWNPDGAVASQKSPAVQFAVSNAQIDAGDMLAWLRAFHPGVADDISAKGTASMQMDASGWPLQFMDAEVSSPGLDFSRSAARGLAHVSEVQLSYDRGVIAVHPIVVSWGGGALNVPSGSFRVDLSSPPSRKPISTWHIAGNTTQMRDLIAGAGALGLNISRGWALDGEFACDLRWQTPPGRVPPASLGQAIGWMEFGGSGTGTGDAALSAPFLNRPVEQIKARAEWKPGAEHVALASAQAFGTRWSGTFDRRENAGDWQFALSADRLVAADLDRWLNPRWRESFLGRMLPFLNSRSTVNAVPEDLRAGGHLALGQFTLEPFDVRHLDADLKIDGRHIALAKASAQFYGGTIAGLLDADLGSAPSYNANLNFSRLDLAELSAESPSLAGLFGGSASGSISLQTRGATRPDLLANLDCQGTAQIANPRLLSIDLGESLHDGIFRSGSDQFADASAGFSCVQKSIEFQTLELMRADETVRGTGTIDFGRNLDLRVQLVPAQAGRPAPVYRLTGPLSAPQLVSAGGNARRSR